MKNYLIYFAQAHERFRKAELESLADFYSFPIDLSSHDESSPFMLVQLENDAQAQKLLKRAVLARGIYELWGEGFNLESLHGSIKDNSQKYWKAHQQCSFKFDFIDHKGSRSQPEQVSIIESFAYLGFQGPIRMKKPDEVFAVLEEFDNGVATRMIFGRQVQLSNRVNGILDKYDLKKRRYIGTTSFDAELSLVSCNIAQVGPCKVVYDPFAGTGSFLVAGANYGAQVFGSDIDIRILKGKGKATIEENFKQYGTSLLFGDVVTMDFTHNAFRSDFVIDTIVCDPPYGVREGLKVCGTKYEDRARGKENLIIDGEKAYLRKDFIQPKKPYELDRLLDDLLLFAAQRLPIGGRLCFWMPTSNEDFQPTQIPQHESLELLYNLEQEFNKWSRRLLCYVKRGTDYQGKMLTKNDRMENNFRERYFQGFSEKKVGSEI